MIQPILSESGVVVGTIEGSSIHRRKIGEVLVSRQQSSSVRWLLVTSFCVFFAVAGIAEGAEPSSDMPVAFDAHDAQLKWGPCPPLFPKGCEIAVLRGDPSEPNADVFLKVPANYTIPPHWHTSAERMVLVSGELHVEYDGHSSSVLKPGTYAYGPAKLPHKASCKGSAACVLFIAFEAPVDAHSSDDSKR